MCIITLHDEIPHIPTCASLAGPGSSDTANNKSAKISTRTVYFTGSHICIPDWCCKSHLFVFSWSSCRMCTVVQKYESLMLLVNFCRKTNTMECPTIYCFCQLGLVFIGPLSIFPGVFNHLKLLSLYLTESDFSSIKPAVLEMYVYADKSTVWRSLLT